MLVLLVSLAFVRARAPQIAAEKPEKLRIAYITISGSMAACGWQQPLGISRMKGSTSNSSISKLTLQSRRLAGEVDAVEISAPGIVPVVLAGGNLTMIAGLLNKMIYSFMRKRKSNQPRSCGERSSAPIVSEPG